MDTQTALIEQLRRQVETLEAENYRLRDLLSIEWQAKRRLEGLLNQKQKRKKKRQ